MEYGCIGEHLSHSFSKEIHAHIAPYSYELCEVAREDLDVFMTKRDFKAINVTIPYKQDVIPYLYEISPEAKAIGAVNTVVNRGGRLYGYNTDFYGIVAALSRMGFDTLRGKKVLVLGTGGTSRTACAVAEHLGAASVLRVSRSGKDGALTYAEAMTAHKDAAFIFNATPAGMYPDPDSIPIEPHGFSHLEGVFDAVYNPLRTRLVTEARERGVKAACGLYMLVAQAFRAAEIFLAHPLDPSLLETVYRKVSGSKENIVLIGMPSSGKSTVGKALAKALDRPFFDSDTEIEAREGRKIAAIFAEEGEAVFREKEAAVVASLAARTACVIATGGGAVLREESVRRLKQNGTLIFLDRPLSDLVPTADRPTASSAEAIKRRYEERYEVYTAAADLTLKGAKGDIREAVNNIRKELSL